MSKYDVSKFKLKFDKPRQQKPTKDESAKVDTAQKAAKKRWWQKWNRGAKVGSNKESIFDKKD